MENEIKIEGTEKELNELFKESLDGLRDDITEAAENVKIFYEAINNDAGGKDLYWSQYNDALKIKGAARDRFLKYISLLKDRVGKKEDAASKASDKTGNAFEFNHSDLNDAVTQMKKIPVEYNEDEAIEGEEDIYNIEADIDVDDEQYNDIIDDEQGDDFGDEEEV